jgi:putative membrane protein
MLFYLPRLFVYHAMAEDELSKERFKIMERKLYRAIGTPSMLATLIFGVWLVSFNASYYLSSGWFHAKVAIIVLLIGYHHMCGAMIKRFARDEVTKDHVFFRWFNEVPVLFLIPIVILVVVRPF